MLSQTRRRPSVLLGTASAGGTIAAARSLGRAGVKVGIVSSDCFRAAAWSHHVARRHSAPSEAEHAAFLGRLLAIGAHDPGQVLLPTSDQTAWLYAENAVLLDQQFRRYQPPIATLQRILDKKLLAEAATNAGMHVLPNWDPQDCEIAALAPILPYPILIKPRTHVYRARNDKGGIANSANELLTEYERIFALEQADAELIPLIPGARTPILQRFVNVAIDGVHSVTGFIDPTGELFVTRHAVKTLQRSRPAGVGICFESRPSDPSLSSAARRLCSELDYFGIFEIEFVWFEGRWNVIDFNPRLFSQVGLDIRRGMPLPLLVYLAAAGEMDELRAAVTDAQAQDSDTNAVFFDRFTLRALLLAQAVTLRTSRKELAYWRSWTKRNAAVAVDFAADRADWKPGIAHALSEIYLGVKAFPRFLRSTPRARKARARIAAPMPAEAGSADKAVL